MSERNGKALARGERAEIAADGDTTARVVESLVLRGDISALGPEERARFYVEMCDSLGLNAAAQPFAILKLNGKEILYPTRGATDQLAAIHRLSREVVEGPEVRDYLGTKLLYCKARVTHPNGRTETAVATLPAADLAMGIMKIETKAKRRATLAILGLALLDETEVDSIAAHAKSPATPIDVTLARPTADFDETPVGPELAALRRDLAALGDAPSILQAARVWLAHRQTFVDLADADAQHDAQTECEGVLARNPSATHWKEALAVVEAAAATPALAELVQELVTEAQDKRGVVEVWKVYGTELAKHLPAAQVDVARTAAALRVTDLDGTITQPRRWLKEQLAPKPTPPDGPRGGKPAPAQEPAADARGDAYESDDASPTAAVAASLRAYVASKTNQYELERGLAKHRGDWDVSDDDVVAIARDTWRDLGRSEMAAVNAARRALHGTRRAA